jgi:hypothetical protein
LAFPEDCGGVVIARVTDLAEIRDQHFLFGNSREEPFQVAHRIPTKSRVTALSFAHCSDTLAIADDQLVRLVPAGSPESLMEWDCPAAVTFLTLSPQDRLLAVGTATFIVVLDAQTGKQVYRMPMSSPALCLRFSNDGKRLAYVDDGSSTDYAPQFGVVRLEQTDYASVETTN